MTDTLVHRPDPRPSLEAALETLRAVVAHVRPHQLDQPTPCADYDVTDLLGHLLGALRRLAAIGGGEQFTSVRTEPPFEAVADWPAAFAAASAEVRAVWANDALLDNAFRAPWAELAGRDLVATYVNELTVHTWDLATAIGDGPAWAPEILATAWSAIRAQLPAEGRLPGFVPFAEVVPVGGDASPIDRLVAWNGRNPNWPAMPPR